MNIARLIQITAIIAGLAAVTLGMGTYTHANFASIHMLFGLLVALALLLLALMAVFARATRRLGSIGIVYAILMPIFGVTQQAILAGELHWLIEAAHLLVGLGALAFIGIISARLVQRKPVDSLPAVAEMSQAVR